MTSGNIYLYSGTIDVEDENKGEIFEGMWRSEFSMSSVSNTVVFNHQLDKLESCGEDLYMRCSMAK